MDSIYEISHDISGIDWWRLADVMARAPLFERKPFELATAFRNSHAVVFAHHEGNIVGAARAVSDGVYYATIYDVVVAPEHQGCSVGRQMVSALLAKLPVERVFLTSVFGKEGFYERFGFLRQTNAMGRYVEPARGQAIASGVLTAAHTASSLGATKTPN
ncbi:MAG: GNAT family N-acetyltransferase [Alphaproteobacteria bacterium]|nr:GNAT family N-acetyltransferase [Alphaproteobacteria bacterium]